MADHQTTSRRGWNLRRPVTLRCPKCSRTMLTHPNRTDPPHTSVVEVICPDCDDGDFHESSYFNAAGQQIDCDKGQPL